MLTRIEINNYKSLHEISLELPRFCCFVGANAAGKSNLADAIDFLALALKNGLPGALDAKGGYDNICFRKARRAKTPMRFCVVVQVPKPVPGFVDEVLFEFRYEFSFRARQQRISSGCEVKTESLRVRALVDADKKRWENVVSFTSESDGPARFMVSDKGKFHHWIPGQEFLTKISTTLDSSAATTDLLLSSTLRRLPPFVYFCQFLESFRVFQIMPTSARSPASASGEREMGRHGENLPAALSYLQQEHPESFQHLIEQLQLAVPTVEGIETDYVQTRQLGLFLKEEGMARRLFASELSDGTLRTVALFVPLVDPRCGLVVIEEPENSVHPWVAKEFAGACRDRSLQKQVLLTTHSPVLVGQLAPEEIRIVQRTNGETSFFLPEDIDEAIGRVVSSGEMDLGQLWESGAMGGVPVQLSLW